MSIEDVEVTIRYFHLFLHFQSRFIFRFFFKRNCAGHAARPRGNCPRPRRNGAPLWVKSPVIFLEPLEPTFACHSV